MCAARRYDGVSDIYYFLLPSSGSACTKRRWDFYSVKVEWLARRRWHMATKITTVTRLTNPFGHQHQNRLPSFSPFGSSRCLHDFLAFLQSVFLFSLFSSFDKVASNLNCIARSSLPDFPFSARIVLSLLSAPGRDLRSPMHVARYFRMRKNFPQKNFFHFSLDDS